MKRLSVPVPFCLRAYAAPEALADLTAALLPPGFEAVWDLKKAYRETTPTRERICLNGLWQWQPVEDQPGQPPAMNWGCFKVPGCWPGITDYMQKDSQRVYPNPSWKTGNFGNVTAAWYQRRSGQRGQPIV